MPDHIDRDVGGPCGAPLSAARGDRGWETRGGTRHGPWWSLAALPLAGVGAWTLGADVPVWNTLWYLFAWYAWLLALDAAVHALEDRSWLAAHGRRLPLLLFWSVPFWYLYEAYNLRIENWYYVFALRNDRLQLVVSVLAFATVLPACLLHAELAAALGVARRARWRALPVGGSLQSVVVVLAAVSIVAPIVWPRWAFPLVWGATLWLPELVNFRRGAPSLLGDLAQGQPARLLQLLTGGVLAGLVWELLNFWARCKWIYTVPGFERGKLFEMPFLGFLGFPLLTLGAFASWSLLEPGRRPQRLGFRRVALVTVGGVAAVLCVVVYREVLAHTLRSRRPLLAELVALDASAVAALERAGIATPERLDRAVALRGVGAVAAVSRLPDATVGAAAAQSALALHKGMGAPAARLLLAAGVPDVATLARQDPPTLGARLRSLAATQGIDAPREVEVRVWVAAARGRTRPSR